MHRITHQPLLVLLAMQLLSLFAATNGIHVQMFLVEAWPITEMKNTPTAL